MMPKDTKVGFSPQRLATMLSHAVAREDEEWRKNLIQEARDKAKDISPVDRDLSIVWISQLTARFHFSPETFFLALVILDRFITAVKVRPKYMKCVALTCFYVASKFTEEEEDVPGTREFIENSDCGCRGKDVLRMERIILTKLEWRLHTTTPLEYLQIFHMMSHTQNDENQRSMKLLSRDLTRMTLELQQVVSHYPMAVHSSATLALAILSLDLESLSEYSTNWLVTTSQLQSLIKVPTSGLMLCRERMALILPHKVAPHTLRNRVYLVTPSAHKPAKKRKLPTQTVADISNSIKKLHTRSESYNDLQRLSNDLDHANDANKPSAELNDSLVDDKAPPSSSVERVETPPPILVQPKTPDGAITTYTVNDAPKDDDGCYSDVDSDATITASEGEEEEEQRVTKQRSKRRLRPLTYAEIVKCGILTSHATDITIATMNAISGNTTTCC